jgi:hypothetical protein
MEIKFEIIKNITFKIDLYHGPNMDQELLMYIDFTVSLFMH